MLSKKPLLVLSSYILISASLFIGGAYLYENLIRNSLTQNMADTYLQTLSQLQSYYAREIVPRAVNSGAELTAAPAKEIHKIPFPATFTNTFGEYLQKSDLQLNLTLYSDHPFAHKRERQLDSFSRRALDLLAKGDTPSYSAVELRGETQVMRVAAPVYMGPSCVECHNSSNYHFPVNWQVGDFRGVREVTIPMPEHSFTSQSYVVGALLALGCILCGFLVVWPVIAKLNRTLKELKSTSAALLHSNNHDALTGLPIVRLCRANLHREIQRCREENSQCALMFIDLDGFKQVNDTFGHAVGDTVLRMAAERIRAHMRDNDTPARVGGDEFAVLLSDITAEDTLHIASRLNASLSQVYEIQSDKIYSLSASIGIALYPAHGSTPDTLFKQADSAMYEIKNSGKNSFALYED
ncbi:MAG: diguanylate cyclase [Pseudomonadales bacterium]